jgi:hypothetical protein
MHAVVDRLENGYAVVLFGEDEICMNIPLSLLPSGVGEGDCLKVNFEPDPDRTQERRAKIHNLLEKLINQEKP